MDAPRPDAEDVEAIIEAALEGHLDEVRRLVQQDRRLLEADDGKSTPLELASGEGHLEVVRYLLDEGAQVDLRAPDGWTALGSACWYARSDVVSLLLAHGADTVAAGAADGTTPLVLTSTRGHPGVLALLLAHGCGDIDRREGKFAQTALDQASVWGHVGALKVLLGAGADPHVLRRGGQTPPDTSGWKGEECAAALEVRARARARARACVATGCR
jgi:ankyrin repeat protein